MPAAPLDQVIAVLHSAAIVRDHGMRACHKRANKEGEVMSKKKKRGAPERACVKCGKGYHPRRKECPHCGKKSPRATKKTTRKIVAKRAGTKQPERVAKQIDTLDVAIQFVESAGGFKAAMATLEKLERIKSL